MIGGAGRIEPGTRQVRIRARRKKIEIKRPDLKRNQAFFVAGLVRRGELNLEASRYERMYRKFGCFIFI